MNKLILLGCSLLMASGAMGDTKEFFYQRFLHRNHSVHGKKRLPEQFFTQKVNHDDPTDTRTYKQRYYVDDSYASGKEAPVFFVICGEAACTSDDLSGAVQEYAQKYNAYLIALEHRYYGVSIPMPTLSNSDLVYLTTEQALADAADFEVAMKQSMQLTGKWISFGGSYPGSVSAYYRLRHPELVVGSLASSGPVQANANFEEYDHHVWKVAGTACAAQMRQMTTIAEAAMGDTDKMNALKLKFQAQDLVDYDDFLYLIADMGALAIQYGYRDQFCKMIATGDPTEGYAKFTADIFQSWNMTAVSDSVQGSVSEDPKDYQDGIGNRSWSYQSCNEYGYWQNAYHDPSESVRSARINPQFHLNLCKKLFNITTPVNTSKVNDNLYQPLLMPSTSNILFTNGSNDPWSLLGISTVNNNATNPNTKTYLIDGAAHCADLSASRSSDSDSLKGARELLEQLITEWLS